MLRERGVGLLRERSELEDGAVVGGEVLRGRGEMEPLLRRERGDSGPSAPPAVDPDD